MTPLLAVPILNAVGFSAAGPVAGKGQASLTLRYRLVQPFFPSLSLRPLGTLAAGIQSGIGNVAAGSLFAGAQGAAMGAGLPVVANVVGGAVTGVVGLAAAVFA